MKKNVIWVLGLALVSANAFADADQVTYQTDGQAIELHGIAPKIAKVEGFVYFVPTAESLANNACNFPDEQYSPNGKDHSSYFSATYTSSGYVLDLPIDQTRDECHYTVGHIDLSVSGNSALQPLTIVPPAEAAKENSENAGILSPLEAFASEKTMYCDFVTSTGLCDIKNNIPVGPYEVSLKSQKIEFDIRPMSQEPAEAY
jgi:hypothetical protein